MTSLSLTMKEELPTTASDAGADGVVDAFLDLVEPESLAVVCGAGGLPRLRSDGHRRTSAAISTQHDRSLHHSSAFTPRDSPGSRPSLDEHDDRSGQDAETPASQATHNPYFESTCEMFQHVPARLTALSASDSQTSVDASVVYGGRRTHDRERELRHDRDLPVPRLRGNRQPALSLDGVRPDSAGARL